MLFLFTITLSTPSHISTSNSFSYSKSILNWNIGYGMLCVVIKKKEIKKRKSYFCMKQRYANELASIPILVVVIAPDPETACLSATLSPTAS